VTTIYSFGSPPAGKADGAGPLGSLIQGGDGNLYGTTLSNNEPFNGTGTTGVIFKMTLAGVETILQSNVNPQSGLIVAGDGNFYGAALPSSLNTPLNATQFNCGSVYQLTPAGAISTIYTAAFAPNLDDTCPQLLDPSLIAGGSGLLYGALSGENNDDGDIPSETFSLSFAGTLTSLTTFPIVPMPPSDSTALTLGSNGSIYEVVASGGATSQGGIYEITTAGQQTLLYSFGSSAGDAFITTKAEFATSSQAQPLLQTTDGSLYGTTALGGTSQACSNGCGTIFKLSPTGVENVLYSFGSSAQGPLSPSGPLILATDGNFYGLAYDMDPSTSTVLGSIYRMAPDGTVSFIYTFSGPDGAYPAGALLQASDGNLYGTTSGGGAFNAGTVFRVNLGATQ
jgi:uncharacterized repeat protein (TIGR03803 family)